jgi:hypothetical protein
VLERSRTNTNGAKPMPHAIVMNYLYGQLEELQKGDDTELETALVSMLPLYEITPELVQEFIRIKHRMFEIATDSNQLNKMVTLFTPLNTILEGLAK